MDNSTINFIAAQPLIQQWHHHSRDSFPQEYVLRHQLLNSHNKVNNQRYYQHFLRDTQHQQSHRYSVKQHPSTNTPNHDHTLGQHSHIHSQQILSPHHPPIVHNQKVQVSGFRTTDGSLSNHFSHPRPHRISHQHQAQNTLQETDWLLLNNKLRRYFKDQHPDLYIHDLTSAFYNMKKVPLNSLKSEPPQMFTNGRIYDHNKNSNEKVNAHSPFNTNQNYASLSDHEVPGPKPPPKTYNPSHPHEISQDTSVLDEQDLSFDPARYPPSVSYGEIYYEEPSASRATHGQHRVDYYSDNTKYGPPTYWKNVQPRLANKRNAYPLGLSRRDHLIGPHFPRQTTEIYPQVGQRSDNSLIGLYYARLPSGYESPTTTFEVMRGKEMQGNIEVRQRPKMNIEVLRTHASSFPFNGHGGPHVMRRI